MSRQMSWESKFSTIFWSVLFHCVDKYIHTHTPTDATTHAPWAWLMHRSYLTLWTGLQLMQSTSHIILAIVKADTLLNVNDSYVYVSSMTYIELCSIVVISCYLLVQVAYACPLQGTVFTRLTHVPEMNVFHRGLLVSGMPVQQIPITLSVAAIFMPSVIVNSPIKTCYCCQMAKYRCTCLHT